MSSIDFDSLEFEGFLHEEPTTQHLENESIQVDNRVFVRQFSTNRVYSFVCGDIILEPGDEVIIETDRGLSMGVVLSYPEMVLVTGSDHRRIVRRLTREDVRLENRNISREVEAFTFCYYRIKERKLPMKLINVEYMHGGNKAVFYFSADGRIDFRELVRDLAQRFRIRIEMRQIGIRDESKMIGGIGPCGIKLCCTTFLQTFAPVTIRMAKTQNLVLNPQKVSGVCGRLMCCLAYENDTYEELKREFPKIGQIAVLEDGEGQIREVNLIAGYIKVEVEPNVFREVRLAELKTIKKGSATNGDPEDPREIEELSKLLDDDENALEENTDSKPRGRQRPQGRRRSRPSRQSRSNKS